MKAVMARVPVAFVRSVVMKASTIPEVAARLPEGESTVAVRVTGDEEMAELNRTYADVPDATDVLSFSGVGAHIGDIALSWPAIERQAARFGHDARTELALLSVHGFLHLLGWDHARARERKEMTRLTVAALKLSRITLAEGRL
ncbi:MAG TPA: rRNA maturation RNase YbeY [Candidatus Dormibacteraeota bacterium]